MRVFDLGVPHRSGGARRTASAPRGSSRPCR
jgi:hypothetical protein